MRPHACVDASYRRKRAGLGVYIPTHGDFFKVVRVEGGSTRAEVMASEWGIELMEGLGYTDFVIFTDCEHVKLFYKGPHTVVQVPRYMNAAANSLAYSALTHGSYPDDAHRAKFAKWHQERLVMHRSEVHL